MFETKCPACGASLGAVATFRHYANRIKEFFQGLWYRLWGGRSRVGQVQCPCCKQFSDFTGPRCQNCGLKFNVKAVFLWYLLPLIRRVLVIYESVLSAPRRQRLLLVVVYLCGSVAIFLYCFNRAQAHFGRDGEDWGETGPIAILFTTLLLVATAYILPNKHKLLGLLRLWPAFRIGVVLNFLSFLLFTLTWVVEHEQKATTLVAAFLLALGTCFVFARVVYPLFTDFAAAFYSMFPDNDPSTNQSPKSGYYRGRRAEFRERKW